MCGIIGVVSKNVFDSNDALKILKKLEYRGYDSFGIATDNGFMEKHIGEITSLEKNNCTKALCHTRWATHGAITEVNAHPHTDCRKKIFIVHNGIIENYLDIKSELQKNGCCFTSNTDSEVIAHFFEQYENVIDGIRAFFKHAEGNFAIALMKKGDDNLYAFKRGSPLADRKSVV